MPDKKKPGFDSERETRVLLEDVRSQLRVVGEGHGLLANRLDKVEGSLREVKSDLQEVKDDFRGVKGQLNQLQKQVGSVLIDHESRIKSIETRQ